MTETLLTYRPELRIFEDAEELREACDEALKEAESRVEHLSAGGHSESFLEEWDDLEILIEDVFGPVSLLSEVHPSAGLREVADEKLVELTAITTRFFQNEALFREVSSVEPDTGAGEKLKKDLIEEFEDNGVHLDPDHRERVRGIVEEISKLSQEFSRNIRENVEKVAFDEEEIEGLPDHIREELETKEGRYLVGLDYPQYNPFMMNVHSEEAKKKLFLAYHRRGGERNVEILDRVTELRSELASLYGLSSYAELIIRRKMARTPESVHELLSSVLDAVAERERADLEALREEKKVITGEEKVEVHRWDTAYLLERLREKRFAIDQEALRSYFPTDAVTAWILELSSRLYGIRFERMEREVWHRDVLSYDLSDVESGHFIGSVYLDLFPREGKYKHAAAWPVRGVSRRAKRTPISVLVANFDRQGLTQIEVETYLHEFGHVLHGVLSKTWFNRHAGTSVERDFVEAPSQMFEWWARRMEGLEILSDISEDNPRIDEDLVERLDAARRFGRGIHYARQHLYASYDMMLAENGSSDTLGVWREMESESSLGYVENTMFPASFAHLTGGYAAGYYGYLWSEAIATDMLTAFGDDLMDRETGRRFRDEILGRGSETEAEEMVERFLGRPYGSEAFSREIRQAGGESHDAE